MPYEPPPDLAELSLADIAQLAEAQKLPPIDKWQPEKTLDSEMCITADGRWLHQGDPIERPAMVRAFSTLLRREDDGSFSLVTPHVRFTIEVEDTPFQAVEVESEGNGEARKLAFRLNTDHLVIANAEHPIRFEEHNGEPRPVLHVRDGLEAKLSRPVYYQLAEWIIEEDNDPAGLWSHGAFFGADAS